jgi:hypothetical protein
LALLAGKAAAHDNYSLSSWDAFSRFLDDGRLCMSNNAAERELRAVAVGRKNWTFAGSDEGGRRAAAIYSLIATAELNDIDPQAWLADVLARLPDHPERIDKLLPLSWQPQSVVHAALSADQPSAQKTGRMRTSTTFPASTRIGDLCRCG